MPELAQAVAHASDTLETALLNRTATVGVVGLGYVGLPLVQAFTGVGFQTIGFDVDRRKVDMLLRGESYIRHIAPSCVEAWLRDRQFDATDDMTRLAEADVLVICVPTPLDESRNPDLRFVESTARQIATMLRPGQLVVLESTTYPGTTRHVVLPLLEQSGLREGSDFFLAYSPEREDPGNENFGASQIPKVVGGLSEKGRQLAELFYRQAIVSVVPVSSPEVAEACKILENVYRSVNIALVNELKTLFDRMNIDVWEVIEAAKTKPFGYQAFYPGPGLGGHCIPIDPFYLSWLARRHGMNTRFIELAGEVNAWMPHYVVERTSRALNEHGKPLKASKICLLGVAYKRDVDDPRESPAFRLMELLSDAGAELSYHDPYIPVLPRMRSFSVPELASETLSEEFLRSQDCVLIVTDHTRLDYDFLVRHAPLVVDTRNATANVRHGREKIWKA